MIASRNFDGVVWHWLSSATIEHLWPYGWSWQLVILTIVTLSSCSNKLLCPWSMAYYHNTLYFIQCKVIKHVLLFFSQIKIPFDWYFSYCNFLAHIPLYLYPFLNTGSKTRPFEYLRLTSLGVIGALVKVFDLDQHTISLISQYIDFAYAHLHEIIYLILDFDH